MLTAVCLFLLVIPGNSFLQFGTVIKPCGVRGKERLITSFPLGKFQTQNTNHFIQLSPVKQSNPLFAIEDHSPVIDPKWNECRYFLQKGLYEEATQVISEIREDDSNLQKWSINDLDEISLLINDDGGDSIKSCNGFQLVEICELLIVASSSLTSYPESFLTLISQLKEQFYEKFSEITMKGFSSFIDLFDVLKQNSGMNLWNVNGMIEKDFLLKIIEFYSFLPFNDDKRTVSQSDAGQFVHIIFRLSYLSAITNEMPEWNDFLKAIYLSLEAYREVLTAHHLTVLLER
jgi:hypothetical protein